MSAVEVIAYAIAWAIVVLTLTCAYVIIRTANVSRKSDQ